MHRIRLRNRPEFSRRKFDSDCSLARVPLSTGFPPKKKNRLPSAHGPPDSIVDQKLAGHLALHHACSPGYFEVTRSYQSLRLIERCCIKPSDASNGSSETRSFDFRALPSNLVNASSTDATNTGDGYRTRGDPLPTSKGSRRLGGRLSSLRPPIAHATFLFLAGSEKKKQNHLCMRASSYIYSHDRIRAISAESRGAQRSVLRRVVRSRAKSKRV